MNSDFFIDLLIQEKLI